MNALITGISLAHAPDASGQGYVDGHALLKDLSGHSGHAMRSVAIGYVMAIHDALRVGDTAAAPARADGALPAARPTLGEQALAVEDWLREHPQRLDEVAAVLVRAALGHEPPAAAPRGALVALRKQLQRRVSWDRATALGALGAGAVALTIGMLVVHGTQPATGAAPLVRNVQIIEGADDITKLVLEERRYEKDSFLNIGNRNRFAMYTEKWSDSRAALAGAIAHLAAIDMSAGDRQILADIAGDFHEYARGCDHILALIRNERIHTPQDANMEFALFKTPARRMELDAALIKLRASRDMGVTA